MTDKEAMMLALDALTYKKWFRLGMGKPNDPRLEAAITALKERLAQEKALQALHEENERLGLYRDAYGQPEPVAWVNKERNTITWDKLYPDMDALYTHPPQRTEDKS